MPHPKGKLVFEMPTPMHALIYREQFLAEVFSEDVGAQKMYERLGEFICNYARVEQACHILFDGLSGLPRKVSRTIMGSALLGNLLPVLTNLVDLSNLLDPERKAEYHICVEHLNHITELRHRLIHRGASISGEEIRSSNELIAKSKETTQIINFHIDNLKAAADDCRYLEFRLLCILAPYLKSDFIAYAPEAFAPWRYKPVQLDNPSPRPRNTRQSKRHQRAASPE